MCNLLIPLCPFVLHSVMTSSQNIQPHCSSDARILFSYLSKKSYDSSTNPAVHQPSQKPPKPLAQKTTKLYKRTNWHTCACFFRRVSVLHPMPGPSRPTFVTSHKYCARCSNAAKTLRPMRMGGLGDKTDPYWDRCIFAGARGVFENGLSDGFDVSGGNLNMATPTTIPYERYAQPSSAQPLDYHIHDSKSSRHFREETSWGETFEVHEERRDWQESRNDSNQFREARDNTQGWTKRHHSYSPLSAPRTYGEDLDKYLANTYGMRDRDRVARR